MPRRDVPTIEALQAYKLGENIQLTETQLDLLNRYEYTFHLLLTNRQFSVVAKKIREKYSLRSVTTAYDYIKCAIKLCGDPIESDKKAMRFINIENQNRLLAITEAEIEKKRRTGGDITALLETASRINERIARIQRLSEEDESEFDPSALQRAKVVYVIPDAQMLKEYEDIMDIDVEILSSNNI